MLSLYGRFGRMRIESNERCMTVEHSLFSAISTIEQLQTK